MIKALLKVIVSILLLVVSENIFSQTPQFAISAGSNDEDISYKTITDPSGNIIVCGSFSGTVDFDPGPGGFNLSSNGDNDIFLAKYGPTGNFIWAFSIGGVDKDEAPVVTTDASGNIFMTGYFRATADFDPSPSVANLVSNGDSGPDPGYGGDGFLAKYSNDGTYQWAFNFGNSTKSDGGQEVLVDVNGDIIVAGFFAGINTDFDPSPSTTFFLGTDGSENQFIAKYSASGTFVWAKELGTSLNGNETIRQAISDEAGNIYVTGFFTNTCDFDPGPGTAIVTGTGIHNGFVAKYSSAGNYVWAYAFGGSGFNQGWGIDYFNNNIYVVGDVAGSGISFSGANGSINPTSIGGFDAFIAKLSSNGDILFANLIGGIGDDGGFDVKVRASDAILYVTGFFSQTADMNPNSGQSNNLVSLSGADVFVGRYLLDGTYGGAFRIGGFGDDFGRGLTLDNTSLILNGYYSSVGMDVDPNLGSTLLLSGAGGLDAFVVKYLWAGAVPLTLESFAGSISGDISSLLWKTQNELGTVFTELERSIDGKTFTTINKFQIRNNNNDGRYKYTDDIKNINSTVFYYRLKFIDVDGKSKFSKVLVLRKEDRSYSLKIFPNPASSWIQLNFDQPVNENVDIVIYNNSGAKLFQKKLLVLKGRNSIQLTNLPLSVVGSCIVTITGNEKIQSSKVLFGSHQ